MAAPPEVRLKRFLHYGSEHAVYNASRGLLKFTEASCSSIPALIKAGKEKEVALEIIKAHSDGYAVHREALLYAMAMCALNKTAPVLKEMAYSAVKNVCTQPEDLFLFFKYLFELNNNHLASGTGVRRVISDWYLKKDVMEFAAIVARQKSYYNWTHSDLFKIAHIKTDDIAKQVVIQFAFKQDLKELTQKFKGHKEAQPVLQFLKVAVDVRSCQDPKIVSRAIEANSLSLEHLPSHNKDIMDSDEVWCSLITGMPFEQLLDNLQYLSRHHMLRPRAPNKILCKRYCDAIGNVKALAESNIHPARVLIEVSSFNLRAKEKLLLATRLKHPLANKKPPQLNDLVVDELQKVLESSFKLLVPTGQRYLIAIDTRSKMWTKRCWKNRYVNCAEAAALLAQSIYRAEREVIVGVFGHAKSQDPFLQVDVSPDSTLMSLMIKMRENSEPIDPTSSAEALLAAMNKCSLKSPVLASSVFDWAESNEKQVDVFVCLGDNTLDTLNLSTKLAHYRSSMHLQNAKMVHVHLNGPAKNKSKSKGNGLLAINGFDKNVPRVIEAFARGAF